MIRHDDVFENARIAMWDLDFSALVARLDDWRAQGITDPRAHLERNPDLLRGLVSSVRVVDVNPYAVELFEAADKDEFFRGLGTIFLPETAQAFLSEIEALWQGKRRMECEAVVSSLRGRRMDVLVTIYWGGEHCERSLVTLLDISPQKAAQRDAALLASIVESSEDAILSKDLDGTITSWNAGAERLYGYTAAEMIGQSVTALIPPENHAEEFEILARIRTGLRVDHYETVRRRKDGRLIDVSLTVSPVRNAEGQIIGASKVARDISDRKSAEQALAQRADEQAALFEFTDRLYRAVSRSDVFEAALDAITRGLRCDRASILLFDAGGVMRFVAWRGLSDGYRKAVDGHSPWTTESRDPPPIHINDIETADLPDELRNTIRGEGIGALAFFPLLARGRVIGKFMAYCREPHRFTAAELDLGVTIARQLGFSLERTQSEEQRDILVAELSHRVKNTLTTVQSIARQTFAGGGDMRAVQTSFEARLGALAQTHTRLAEENWAGVSLETILLDELTPYRGENGANIRLEGPRIELNAKSAVMLGMVIHELATNAAKHGALSTEEGAVEVRWELDGPAAEGRQLAIHWTESGGPRVQAPTRNGFGRLLLERAVPMSLMGSVQLDFQERGLSAVLRVPVAKIAGQ